jgi:hypothetical protein
MMDGQKIGDPADRATDTAADGQFQPAPAERRDGQTRLIATPDGIQVHRAGYGTDDAATHRLFRTARAGGSLYAGEGKRIIDHYESAMRAAIATGDAGSLDEALRFGKD